MKNIKMYKKNISIVFFNYFFQLLCTSYLDGSWGRRWGLSGAGLICGVLMMMRPLE